MPRITSPGSTPGHLCSGSARAPGATSSPFLSYTWICPLGWRNSDFDCVRFYHRTAHHGALLECSVTSPEEARRAEEIWALEVGGGAGHFPCARNILLLLVQLESSQEALVSHEKMKPGSSFILGCVSETDWPGCSGCRDHRCRCARHGPPASGCGATSHAHPSLLCSLWPLVFLSSLL